MTQRYKVCRTCKLFVKGSVCPLCNQSSFSRSWKGVIVINDTSSEVAELLGITAKGKYCLWVR